MNTFVKANKNKLLIHSFCKFCVKLFCYFLWIFDYLLIHSCLICGSKMCMYQTVQKSPVLIYRKPFYRLNIYLNFIVGGYVAPCSLLKVYSIFMKVLFWGKPVENGKLNRPLKTRTCHRITEWFVRRPRGAMKRDLSSSLALGLQLFITSIWMMKNKTKQNKHEKLYKEPTVFRGFHKHSNPLKIMIIITFKLLNTFEVWYEWFTNRWT